VQAQIAPLYPALAAELIAGVQQILDAMKSSPP